MKSFFEQNVGTYRTEGDYIVPNLAVPEEPPVVLGKYALLRKQYLQQHRGILFVNLLTTCQLNKHLLEIEQAANERMELITVQMMESQGATKQLKSEK